VKNNSWLPVEASAGNFISAIQVYSRQKSPAAARRFDVGIGSIVFGSLPFITSLWPHIAASAKLIVYQPKEILRRL